MVVTDDPELAERARLLRSHGLTSDTWARHRGDAVSYDVLEPGFNFRLDEPRAALGVRLLDRLAADNRRRAAHAARYGAALAGIDGVEPVLGLEEGVENAWHIYPVLLAPGVDRRQFRQSLREAGVQTSVHYPPLHLTSAFARPREGNGDPVAPRPATEGDPVGPGPATASDPAGSLPTTEDYARRTVTIPIFPHLTESQQEQVLLAIAAALRRPS
jgi:dTDP-4-amino-4,6-dideoxygalactose transaminase